MIPVLLRLVSIGGGVQSEVACWLTGLRAVAIVALESRSPSLRQAGVVGVHQQENAAGQWSSATPKTRPVVEFCDGAATALAVESLVAVADGGRVWLRAPHKIPHNKSTESTGRIRVRVRASWSSYWDKTRGACLAAIPHCSHGLAALSMSAIAQLSSRRQATTSNVGWWKEQQARSQFSCE
ncbi:hypothetical protein GQ54DRAFT_322535 [Martensiomyces pterosporus]|nr:hypothetical protein GQ54DRAFT_322535 [Martensiomyces pterosporus]